MLSIRTGKCAALAAILAMSLAGFAADKTNKELSLLEIQDPQGCQSIKFESNEEDTEKVKKCDGCCGKFMRFPTFNHEGNKHRVSKCICSFDLDVDYICAKEELYNAAKSHKGVDKCLKCCSSYNLETSSDNKSKRCRCFENPALSHEPHWSHNLKWEYTAPTSPEAGITLQPQKEISSTGKSLTRWFSSKSMGDMSDKGESFISKGMNRLFTM